MAKYAALPWAKVSTVFQESGSGLLRKLKHTRALRASLRLLPLHGPVPDSAWIKQLRVRLLRSAPHPDPALTRAVSLQSNAAAPDCERNHAPELFQRAVELGCLDMPTNVRRWVEGRDVLDIGCGTGAHGIGFVMVGARSYTGVDPRIDPHKSRVKDNRSREWVNFGWTGEQIMQRIPRIRLLAGSADQLAVAERFDVALLHNLTEHHLNLDEVLATIAGHLRSDGQLIFNHHNFYSWNGHHMAPKCVSEIDPNEPEQKIYLDWAHLDFDAPDGHYFHRALNKLRLHEVKAITARYYDIVEWTPVASRPQTGGLRLTPQIRAKHLELDEQDFLTQHVFCRATPKPPREVPGSGRH